MKVEQYLKHTRHIESTLFSVQIERKTMQVTDLKFFMAYYPKKLNIIAWINYELAAVKAMGSTKGIFSYNRDSCNCQLSLNSLQHCKKQTGIEKLWFVSIQEKKKDTKEDFYRLVAVFVTPDLSIVGLFDNVFILQLWRPKLLKVHLSFVYQTALFSK